MLPFFLLILPTWPGNVRVALEFGMTTFPAISLEALFAGLSACGIADRPIRARLNLADCYTDPNARLPVEAWQSVWAEAQRMDAREDLPARVALGIPFGLFGIVDYLAGSSETVGGGLQALADHFSAVSSGTRIELTKTDSKDLSLRLLTSQGNPVDDEFTACIILNRFRQVTDGQFQPRRLSLTRARPEGDVHVGLLKLPVIYAAPHAGFDVEPAMLELRQNSSDAGLHRTLIELAKRLSLGTEGTPDIELSIRARLRDLLPLKRATAGDLALAIGLSERTLHRRLSEAGSSFQRVVDDFRVEEADRLLLSRKMPLVQIAHQLGYADQASWSRAYKRLRGTSPRGWRSRNETPGEAD